MFGALLAEFTSSGWLKPFLNIFARYLAGPRLLRVYKYTFEIFRLLTFTR